MMPLSQIRAFDRTVTEDGHSAVADRLAAPWTHDPGSVRFFRTSANIVVTLSRNGRRAFLRASAASERTRRTIEDELRLIEAVAAAQIPVVTLIASDRGERIETIETSLGRFHVVLFDGLPGTHRADDALTEADYARWGDTVGSIHAALAAIPCQAIARTPSWQYALDAIDADPSIPISARDGARRLRASLERLPRSPAWYGVLHGDLELDNLTWDGERVWTLDFDAASCGWYLLDLAKALSDPFAHGLTLADAPISAFIGAYQEQHPLPATALDMLPAFQLLARAVDYVAIRHALDMAQADADVDWLHTLIGRLDEGLCRIEAELAAFPDTTNTSAP
ncbi:MAG: phosphotransferase [Thermomicrobiales bacterium]